MVDRIVLDSSVILSYLRRDPGRGEVVRSALYQATQTPMQTRFLASTVAVTEVAYVEGLAIPLSDGFEVIDRFWATSPIHLVEAHAAIAFRARDLMRQRLLEHDQPQFPNVRKRAADLLHLSTAIWLAADEFWTYDVADFQRYPQTLVSVCEPHVDQMMLEGLM